MRPKRSTAARTAASASARLVVAGGQGGFDEIDAHATAGSSDEPDLPVSHGIIDTQPNLHHLTKAQSTSIYLHKRGSNQPGNFSEFARIPNRENGFAKISSESGCINCLGRKTSHARRTQDGTSGC